MKTFLVSFVLSVTACLAMGYFTRQASLRLRAIAPAPVTSVATQKAVSGSSAGQPGSTWSDLEKSRESLEAYQNLTAEQWAALDAMDDALIVARVKAVKPEPRNSLWAATVVRWASIDGPAAMAFAKGLRDAHPRTGAGDGDDIEPGGQFDDLALDVFACWLRHDPTAALASGEPTGGPQSEFKSETLAQTDFSRALDLLALQRGHFADSVFCIIGNGSTQEPDCFGSQLDDPSRRTEFVRWLANCPDKKLASAMFSRVYCHARHEGAWLRPENLPAYMPGREAFPATLEDPDTAIVMGALAMGEEPHEYLERYGKQVEREAWNRDIEKDCVAGWAYRDPESAMLWMQAQELTPDRDMAIVGYADGIWRTSPEQAVHWSERITRPGTRLRECAKYFPRWHHIEPEKADAWLASAGFPEVHRLYIAAGIHH